MKRISGLVLVLLTAAAFAALGRAATLTTIGAAAAVHGRVSAVAPGTAVGRVINSGKPLFLNDHVTTDRVGKLQVLLRDETVFTLGPNADMVLDEFVYDPKSGGGKVTAQIGKGAFRFVTGKVARAQPENMTVKLKVGTIGIRGTVVVGETGPAGSVVINAGAGPNNNADERPSAISLSNEGKSVFVTQTGEGAKVLPGQAPTGPFELTKELDRISALLQEKPSSKQASAGRIDDASKASGQSAAAGKALLAEDAAQQEASQNADATMVESTQQGLQDGIARWADLAELHGTAVYQSPTFSVPCSGTGCGTNDQADFSMNVNFDARAITGGNIAVSGTGFGSDSSAINTTAFGTSGPATVNPNLANANFNSTAVSFVNQGGVPAAEAQMALQYNNVTSNVHINTTLTAPKR